MAEHKGLPVSGYKTQSDENVKLVNANKQLEEMVLRQIDSMKRMPQNDQRMVSEALTCIQTGFMWLNRAVFQPARIALPGDSETQATFTEFMSREAASDPVAQAEKRELLGERPVEYSNFHGYFVYVDNDESVPDDVLKRRGIKV